MSDQRTPREGSLDLLGAPRAPRFDVVALLGRGAMGQVYRALDREMGIEVALKTLGAADPESLYRLKHEFRLLAGVTHDNLIELYELWVSEGDSFFTMELIEGLDFLAALHVAGGDPGWRRLCAVTRQLVAGVSALHHAGRLHRDLKPGNVMVTSAGRVVILDFGLSTILRPERGADAPSALVGTIAYLAPELGWGREQSPASDWYSVGVILYEAVAGRLPFDGTAAAVLVDKARAAPAAPSTLAPGIPPALDRLVTGLLAPSPRDRLGPDDILGVLDELAAEPPGRPRREPPRRLAAPLFGREGELTILRDSLAAVDAGHSASVRVLGPSGIGKTALVEAFLAAEPAARGLWTLRGRCHPQEAVPFNAFDALMDELADRLADLPADQLGAIAPRRVADVLRIFPVLGRVEWGGPAVAPLEGAELFEVRRRGFAALRELLARLADRHRLVLWIDDLQWADADSIALLRELRRAPDAPAVLFVLSHRDDAGNESWTPGADDGVVDSLVALGPLTADATHALAAHLCRERGASEAAAAVIAAESAGSPFFVSELVRHDHLDGADDLTPPRLGEVILARVDGLSEPARRLLEVISLAGQPLDRGLALAAAGLGEGGRPVLTALANACLLRSTLVHARPGVQAYHDRIAEVLCDDMGGDRRVAHHAALADAWLHETTPDAEAVFRHSLGAGRRGAAAEWAVRAGDRATDTLAFVRASERYRQALELRAWDDAARADLLARRAGALVNAGQGAAAAPLYADAATAVAGHARLDLRRRSVEQYLVSGHIDDGVGQLRALLAALALPYPASPTRATLGIVLRLVQLWLRYRAPVRSGAPGVSATQLLRVDACNAAAKGLVQVDPIRGTYFSVLGLLLALRSGETTRIGRDLCLGGSALALAGGPLARLGARMLADARRIAAETQTPYLIGIAGITTGVVGMLDGAWEEVVRLCDEGSALLRDRCQGVTWELAIGEMAAIRALEELGEVGAAVARSAAVQRRAEDGGDLYAQVTARLYRAFWRLAEDDVAGARHGAREALALWSHAAYHLQHFYALRLEVYCDIYEGDTATAVRRVAEAWPALQRSNLLRHPIVRVDALILSGRTALAAGNLRESERAARQLSRERRADADAHAALLRAGAAYREGNADAARSWLAHAETGFGRGGARLQAAYARRRLGDLTGGAHGPAVRDEADGVLAARGIVDPARWLAVHAPGFAAP